MTYTQHVESTVAGFIGQGDHYKSVAIPISRDAQLAPIPYPGRKFLLPGIEPPHDVAWLQTLHIKALDQEAAIIFSSYFILKL